MAERTNYASHLDVVSNFSKSFEWLETGKSYEKLASKALSAGSREKAADFLQETGLSYYMSALQAPNPREFKDRMKMALAGYSQSTGLLSTLRSKSAVAKAHHARSRISFIKAHFVSGADAKKRVLEESYRLGKTALEDFEEQGDFKRGAESSSALLATLTSRLNLEWSPARRRNLIKEAISIGRRAIRLHSKSGEAAGLGWVYYLTGTLCGEGVDLFEDPAERGKLLSKSRTYLGKALAISKQTRDHLLRSKVSLWATLGVGFAKQLPRLEFKEALKHARLAKDKEAMADAMAALTIDLAWKIASEEDPETRLKLFAECTSFAKTAAGLYRVTHNLEKISVALSWGIARAHEEVANGEFNLERKRGLLRKAAAACREALRNYRDSGAVGSFASTPAQLLTTILYSLTTVERDNAKKRMLLQEAYDLKQETFRFVECREPFHYWDKGVTRYYPAVIEADLAEISRSKREKLNRLRRAVNSAQEAVRFCKLHFAPSMEIPPHNCVRLATYSSRLSSLLEKLYRLTGEPELLKETVRSLQEAAKFYERAGWPSRVAEASWRIAQIFDQEERHQEASREFQLAAKAYSDAAAKIPRFNEFFSDYATYVAAWSRVEEARACAGEEEYALSAQHYAKAAETLREVERWKHMYAYYLGWSILQEAEEFSKSRRSKEAANAFQRAAEVFSQAEQQLEQVISPSYEDAAQVSKLAKACLIRKQYCLGRAALEEAAELYLRGEGSQSAHKYSAAAEIFEEVRLAVEEEREQKEVVSLVVLCRGWQTMRRAEEGPQYSLYEKAAELFSKAASGTSRKGIASLATANACFCRAMYLAMKFRESGLRSFYSKAKAQLEAAIEHYNEGGLSAAAEWTEATMRIVDAHAFVIEAEAAIDPSERTRLYNSAERCLEYAANLAEKVGYQAKKIQLGKDVERVRHKRELASVLGEVLATPPTAATVSGTASPSPAMERPGGLDAFGEANVQAHIRCRGEVESGGSLQLQVDLVNAGRKPASILRIEHCIPEGFKAKDQPTPYTVEDFSVSMRGRRLGPLQIETIRIPLEAPQGGEFSLSPRVVYLDEGGKVRIHEIEPVPIRVIPPRVFEFETAETKMAFEHLVEAFIEDYMRKRLFYEQAGWRSFVEIAKAARIPFSKLYGRGGRYGPVISELMGRGLVETRIFTRARGRGGEVLKLRAAYDKEPVKAYVDSRVMKAR